MAREGDRVRCESGVYGYRMRLTGAGPGGYFSGSGSGGGSFGSGISSLSASLLPDSVFAEIKTIRERVFWVSYGLFRASSVSHSILFHSVLFSS
jgi:hypothetical protein